MDCDLAEEAKDEAFLGRDLTGADLMDDFAVISQETPGQASSEVRLKMELSQQRIVFDYLRETRLKVKVLFWIWGC